MSRIQCFFIEPNGRCLVTVYRYTTKSKPCPANDGLPHDAAASWVEPVGADGKLAHIPSSPEVDPRVPIKCAHCEYVFTEDDRSGGSCAPLYSVPGGTEEWRPHEAPPGAMYFAEWLDRFGPDGKALVVMTPGGRWDVDSRASNCDLPDDDAHRCWVRHGDPRTGIVTVDKNGLTCNAGAGSIQAGTYHGFLRNGYLEGC